MLQFLRIFFISTLLLLPIAVSAQDAQPSTAAQQSIENLLCTPKGNGTDLVDCVNRLYKFSIAIGLAAAVLFIVIAGYSYMSGTEQGATEAKNIIGTTIAGLAILFVSYILLKQINPDLIKFKPIQLPAITNTGDLCNPADLAAGKCKHVDQNNSTTKAVNPSSGCNTDIYNTCLSTGGTYESCLAKAGC